MVKVSLFTRPKSCSGHCDKFVTQVTKKRDPLTRPIKRDSLLIGFFAVGATNLSRLEACRAYTALLCGVKRHESGRSNLITGRHLSLLRGVSLVGTQTCVTSDSQKNLLLCHGQNGVLFSTVPLGDQSKATPFSVNNYFSLTDVRCFSSKIFAEGNLRKNLDNKELCTIYNI